MAIEFKLPDLGEGIHEAEILAVKVKEGETVKEDQPILEVETDKAVVEIPSPVAGSVERIHVKAGDVVTVGSVMISFNVTAATPARATAGVSKEVTAGSAHTQRPAPAESKPASPGGNGHSAQSGHGPVPAAPATRKMARELNVDLHLIKGSGPGGRVLKEDVRAFAEGVPGSSIAGTHTQAGPSGRNAHETGEPLVAQPLVAQPVDLPDFSKYGPIERVALRSIRRKTAMHMMQSWTHIPHVTHFDEVDITNLESFRTKHEKEVAKRGGRLTFTVFMLKAVLAALRKFPQFNSSLDEKSGEIIYKRYYNIGVAVATERGLIVPVIRNVENKNLTDLAVELGEIAQKTRDGKVELDRLQGGTFTITNLGAIGGTGMVPMINFPEAAILGMARASRKPVVHEGSIEVRLILPLALSFDHRLADGAEAAYFVRYVAECLEEPLKLLLEA